MNHSQEVYEINKPSYAGCTQTWELQQNYMVCIKK